MEVREGEKFIGVYRGRSYKIDYTIDFPSPIGQQKTCIDLAAGDLRQRDCAGADTFGYKGDEKAGATWD